jgi:hypothetical protein
MSVPTREGFRITPRPRFRVECLRCGCVVHLNTTGPESWADAHEKEYHSTPTQDRSHTMRIARHDGTQAFSIQISPLAKVIYLPIPGGVVISSANDHLSVRCPGVQLVYDLDAQDRIVDVRLEDNEDIKADREARAADRASRKTLGEAALVAFQAPHAIIGNMSESASGDAQLPTAPTRLKLCSMPALPAAWTPEERIAVATELLGMIQLDIPAGCYSEIGRPNITAVLHVLHEAADVLNSML